LLKHIIENWIHVDDAQLTVSSVCSGVSHILEHLTHRLFSEGVKHEKNRCVAMLIVKSIRTDKLDIAVSESTTSNVLLGAVAKILDDFDSDCSFCAEPASRENSSSKSATKIDEYVVSA
jgi:hypothetical protein